jgi:capsular polysaccharide biosynthesis protein
MHRGGSARFLYDRIVAAAGSPSGDRTDRRILISRRDARTRRPESEDALEAMFARHGFDSVMLKGMPLAERIRMMQGASIVAGIHGAGLTMLFAARTGTQVYEIMPWMPASLATRCCMAAMSGAFDLEHRVWIEPCDEALQAWNPHLDEMEEDLEAFVNGRPGPRSVLLTAGR